jgi:hypothetical protein
MSDSLGTQRVGVVNTCRPSVALFNPDGLGGSVGFHVERVCAYASLRRTNIFALSDRYLAVVYRCDTKGGRGCLDPAIFAVTETWKIFSDDTCQTRSTDMGRSGPMVDSVGPEVV